MEELLIRLNAAVWGIPLLCLILGVGLYLSIKTQFVQIRLFPQCLRYFFQQFQRNDPPNGISPLRALCTALAATVGTGNIAGVAGAIAIGGPGAIFWMWVSALLGMVLKFAETAGAIHYRRTNALGETVGGPMYMIVTAMGTAWRPLAVLYALFGIIAAFGVGNAVQINAVISGLTSALAYFDLSMSPFQLLMLGMVIALFVVYLLWNGAGKIGETAELLVPFASCVYMLLGLGVLIRRAEHIPQAFSVIIHGAFSPQAVTGGSVGSLFLCLRTGISRGIFTNEAGMGTASIAHASAATTHPVRQGMMGIMEVFIDTILICTMTALVILCSGVDIPYGTDEGVLLTDRAFRSVYGDWISVILALCLCCFAFATILGWSVYGGRCAQYLLGDRAWRGFALAQGVTSFLGVWLGTGTLWLLSETVNGLMAFPNLICLICISPAIIRLLQTDHNIHPRLDNHPAEMVKYQKLHIAVNGKSTKP